MKTPGLPDRSFCYTMLCKCGLCHGLCHHVVSIRLSVMFVDSVKTNKNISSKFFHRQVAKPLVFPYWMSWQHSANGASHAGGIGKNRDLGQYLVCWYAWSAKCNTLRCDRPWRVNDTSCW